MNKKCDGYIRPFRFQLLQSFPYIVEDFDQYTEYQLFCKLVEKVNEVVGNENEITKEVNSIKDYLDTLDLQDEVNEKLDEMAESGELQEIVATYLNANALWCFDSVNDMKNATNLINGSYAKTLGYYEKNDGGSATYKIRTITNNDVVDNMIIIQMTNENLVAELNEKNTINIKQLGAKNSDLNTNNNDIVTFLNCAYNNFNEIVIPSGEYYLSEFSPNSIGIQNKIIRGTGGTKIYTANGFIFNGNVTEPYAQRVLQVYIRDINFYGQGRSNSNRQGVGVTFNHFGECYIDNCYFSWFNQGLKLVEGSETTINNTIALGCNQGFYIEKNTGDLDAVSFNNCVSSNSNVAVLADSVRGLNFNNCVLVNSSRISKDYGVKIKNTYSNTEQINFINCEFENNVSGLASIIVGETDETYTAQFINIINSKFTMYGNYAIDIIKARRLHITNTLFSFSYQYNIRIGENVQSEFELNLEGCAKVLPLYIQDNRTEFHNDYIQSNYKKLNYFDDMKHSITEFIPSNANFNYDNGKLSFTGNSFIAFRLTNNQNVKEEDGVFIVVIGKNIQPITAIINGNLQTLGTPTLQTLSDGQEVKKAHIVNKDLTQIRINCINGTEITKIIIYGNKPSPLPICELDNISATRFIGEPTKRRCYCA